jgi:hypothetical protein
MTSWARLDFVPESKGGEDGTHCLIYVQYFIAEILHTSADKCAEEKVSSGIISGTEIARWNMTVVQRTLYPVNRIRCLYSDITVHWSASSAIRISRFTFIDLLGCLYLNFTVTATSDILRYPWRWEVPTLNINIILHSTLRHLIFVIFSLHIYLRLNFILFYNLFLVLSISLFRWGFFFLPKNVYGVILLYLVLSLLICFSSQMLPTDEHESKDIPVCLMCIGTGMNLKACPWTVGRGLVGDKGTFYYSFQNFGSCMRRDQSARYQSHAFFFLSGIWVIKDSNRFVKAKQYNWILVSGDRYDVFSLESICLTDSSVGSRSSFQIRASYNLAWHWQRCCYQLNNSKISLLHVNTLRISPLAIRCRLGCHSATYAHETVTWPHLYVSNGVTSRTRTL